jgi:hypothetical protein
MISASTRITESAEVAEDGDFRLPVVKSPVVSLAVFQAVLARRRWLSAGCSCSIATSGKGLYGSFRLDPDAPVHAGKGPPPV